MTADDLRAAPLPVDPAGDKHSRGTALVIGGSVRTPGAVLLAGEAALRMGAGRLQILTAGDACTAMAIAMPEALVAPLPTDGDRAHDDHEPDADDGGRSTAELVAAADAVLLGPGLAGTERAVELLELVLPHLSDGAVLVVDAAGLAAIAELDAPLRGRLRGRAVLTPNRDELDQLANGVCPTPGGAETGASAQVASALEVVVTSFGHVSAPDGRAWSCGSGTPGLGTSGSGDVLAGLVLGAGARSHDAVLAACWGTWVHHEAGRRCGERLSSLGYLARDLLGEVPAVLRALETGAHDGVAPTAPLDGTATRRASSL